MTNCPKCNTKNPAGARFCENCGNVLSTPKQGPTQTKDLNFCPDCGKSIEMDASFCAHCGASFGERCPQCQTINQADAKFCEKCAQPLNWICPVCNNKNQAGAMYCENCGSDSIQKKRIYLNPKFMGAAASILILLGVLGMKYKQFNKDIDTAYNYTEDNEFAVAMQYAKDAKNNWLPFTNDKADRTIRYINNREEDYKEQQASRASSNRSSGSSGSSGSSTSSSSNAGRSRVKYKDVATLRFEVYDNISCITKSSLSVSSTGYASVSDVDSYYHTATVITGGTNSGVRGNYRFSWSLVDNCMGSPSSSDYKSYSGSFSIDGKHSDYRIKVYSNYLEVVSN